LSDLSHRLSAALADRYRIERELGRGGMATVLLAEDLKHHRRVAIKVLDPEVGAAIGSERFVREIETVARLTHPHILPLHDSGVADGLLFYVMPYVEGDSLRNRLTREKQLPLEEALHITREVADALSWAHSRGVVHRDIKPENILLEDGHAVVADFGIARAVAAAGGEKLTATGVGLGTPAYMSPEQAAGSRDVDGRSDLYSLGCVLYEMLAGQPPFMGPNAESLAHQHLNLVPRPVTELRPAVPAGVAAALQRALAKTPADRFNPVALFGEALGARESAAGSPVAPPVSSARPKPHRGLVVLGLVVLVAVISIVLIVRGQRATRLTVSRHRTEIAVLPLQNLNVGGPHAYFAGGLHEELLTQLAKVASLKVISRTSVMGYAGTTKPLKQIAAELGVGSIVEGSVQVEGERLRVNVQLIDAATDEHLWAERYDRTLDDAFAIQSDVAQRIVASVGAALTSAEQGRITAAPTANAEAYRLYLQGREYATRPGFVRQNWEIAQHLYERALALDPGFALAHAALSKIHGDMYAFRYESSVHRATLQREEAEAALRLAPDLPQAHLAMGLVQFVVRSDYRRALAEFAIALQGLPNDAELWDWIGHAHRRLGHWSEVFTAFERATRLEPRSAQLYFDLGAGSYLFVHRYADAVRECDRALSLAPDLHLAAIWRGWAYVLGQGQLDTLRATLDRVPKDAEIGGLLVSAAAQRAALLLWERDADGLLREIRTARSEVFVGQGVLLPTALYAGWANQLRGDHAAARAAFESARVRLDSALVELPDDWRVHAGRGLALAGLGRRGEALREARWLRNSPIYRDDAFYGPMLAEERARILAQAGDADASLDEIERLLAKPAYFSVHMLRLDPRWDPIRQHPRFKALLAKYARPEAR
jgi:serine/threonine-protein kinase